MRVHQSLTDDCLRRMQYKLEEPAYYGGSVRALGSGYHKALEIYYLGRMDDQGDGSGLYSDIDLELLVQIAKDEFDAISTGRQTSHISESGKPFGGFIWNKAAKDPETAHELIDMMVRSYFDPEDPKYFPLDWRVLAVEQFFDLPWYHDLTRGGSIDLIMLDPNGWIVCEDHKTAGKMWGESKSNPRKNLQAPWYNWAAQDLFPGYAGYQSSFSVMTYKGQFKRIPSDPDERHIRAAQETLAAFVGMYRVLRANDMDLPPNTSSNLCSPEYCDFFEDVCPYGAALERPISEVQGTSPIETPVSFSLPE